MQAAQAQGLTPSTPAQEYIRLNGQIVAIETSTPVSDPGDPALSLNAAGLLASSRCSSCAAMTMTVDGVTWSIPWSAGLASGNHTIVAPATWTASDGTTYNFVQWNDGSTAATRTINLQQNLQLIATYTPSTPPSAGLQTDQFNAGSVNTGLWSFFSSLEDGSLAESNGHLQIVTGVNNGHYPGTTGNTTIQALQQAANGDFQAEAKFDSAPSESSQGVIALQDESTYVHCSLASNDDGIHPFSGFLSGSTSTNGNYAADIGSAASYWLRLARSGNNWTCSVSTDGVNYSVVTNFSQALTLSKVGVWAGNWAGTPFTAQVDYFSNGFTQPGNSGTPQTDQFNAGIVNVTVWNFFSSLGDGSLAESNGHLQIVTGVNNGHYPDTTGNTAIQALQQVADGDFQVEAKFDSTPSESIMALQDESNYVHCSLASNDDGIHPFSGFLSGSTITNGNYAASIGSASSYWLRLARGGSNWTCSVSTDGVNYSVVTNFPQALTLNKLGVWAGNWAGTPFTAQVDYFSNGFTQ